LTLHHVPTNFLELDAEDADYGRARYAVLPVPYDGGASFRTGARLAPAAIIEASHHCETLDEELLAEFHHVGIATLKAVATNRAGPEAMHHDIFEAARHVVRDGKTLLGIGGDHSVTSGLVRAVMTRHEKLSVLQLDAHTDLRDRFEQTPYSHACVMRRCHELGATIVPVGVRSFCAEESRFMRDHNIVPLTSHACRDSEDWMSSVIASLGQNVYVSLDIDVFDPAYAPGTGTPEPGGLDWFTVTALLRRVATQRRLVGADVVEVIPLPGQAVTEMLAARLLYKLICYIEAAR